MPLFLSFAITRDYSHDGSCQFIFNFLVYTRSYINFKVNMRIIPHPIYAWVFVTNFKIIIFAWPYRSVVLDELKKWYRFTPV